MYFKNAKKIESLKYVGEYFHDKISFFADGEVTRAEMTSMYIALYCVTAEILKTGFAPELLNLNVYFLTAENDSITFELSTDFLGCYNQIVILPVYRWRKDRIPFDLMYRTIIEELCHAVYRLPDGPQLNAKIYSALLHRP